MGGNNANEDRGRTNIHPGHTAAQSSLLLVGVDHTNTPLSLREECAFSPANAVKAAKALTDSGKLDEVIILSTCNKTEAYVLSAGEGDYEQYLRSFLSDVKKTKVFFDRSQALRRDDISAAEHLRKSV